MATNLPQTSSYVYQVMGPVVIHVACSRVRRLTSCYRRSHSTVSRVCNLTTTRCAYAQRVILRSSSRWSQPSRIIRPSCPTTITFRGPCLRAHGYLSPEGLSGQPRRNSRKYWRHYQVKIGTLNGTALGSRAGSRRLFRRYCQCEFAKDASRGDSEKSPYLPDCACCTACNMFT